MKNFNKNQIFISNKNLLFLLTILISFVFNNFTVQSQIQHKEVNIIAQSPSSKLDQGDAVVTGEKGLYEGQVIIDGSIDQVWKLLTDYDNLENYFPDVKSSKLLESNKNKKIFEQVRTVNVLFLNIESKVKIAATEKYPENISFSLLEGNLDSLQGNWQLKKLPNNKVLVINKVKVKPNLESAEEDLFYRIYKQSIKNTLEAIKKEIETGNLS